MQFHTFERADGDWVAELDSEAIDYLVEGLQELRESEPGTQLTTPSLVHRDGVPQGVASYVLLRLQDNGDGSD